MFSLKLILSLPPRKYLRHTHVEDYVRELDEVVQGRPEMVLVVVPDDNSDRYAAIKKKLTVQCGVLSQCAQQRSLEDSKKVRQLAGKLLIQMHTKRGFAPWKTEVPLKGLMAIGFDVTRDTRDASRSFGSFVATMDHRKSDAFYTGSRPHRNEEELCTSFGEMTLQAVKAYEALHGALPEHLVVYRDGVSEGQVDVVFLSEVEHLKMVLRQLYGERPVKMAFVVVNKRVNMRFFFGIGNPKAGTIVDDVVTVPGRWDFYLIPQNVTQGTATPVYFHVLHSTLGISADLLHELTYQLCHSYYNW